MPLERIWTSQEQRDCEPATSVWQRSTGAVNRSLALQADQRPLWLPVFFAAGIAFYFLLPIEPHDAVFVLSAAIAGVIAVRRLRRRAGPVLLLVAMALAGFALAKAKTEWVSTAALKATTGKVSISGWVVEASRRGRSRASVVLDVYDIPEIRPAMRPRRVRVTFAKLRSLPVPGRFIAASAMLYPLPSPVEPGSHDFGRALWYSGIGATGFSFGLKDVKQTDRQPDRATLSAWIAALRNAVSARIAAVLPARLAALCEALLVGKPGQIETEDRTALQTAGLAHILAISGLHMTLVAGGVFWLIRALLALSPMLALTVPIKKWAAMGALLTGAAYLVLTGHGIATQRAFVMLSVMCLAVLCDRPAFSMRNLAIAALIVLVLSPHSVVSASFQMSFLAVMGLIAAYEYWGSSNAAFRLAGDGGLMFRISRWALMFITATAATTLIAGLFTALPAAYHFHRFAPYSLLANVAALPVVSFVVMPGLLFAAVMMPLGLEAPGLWAAGWGIDKVLTVAHWIASLDGASIAFPAWPWPAAVIAGAGAVWLCLWRGPVRLAGVVMAAGGVSLGLQAVDRPDILVERFGRNAALRNISGELVPAHARRGRFSVERWLAADGDSAKLGKAHKRNGWSCDKSVCRAKLQEKQIIFLMRGARPDVACTGKPDIVIAAMPLRQHCKSAVTRIDRFDLWRAGAHAIRLTGGQLDIQTANQRRGARPWTVNLQARKHVLTEDALKAARERREKRRKQKRQNDRAGKRQAGTVQPVSNAE